MNDNILSLKEDLFKVIQNMNGNLVTVENIVDTVDLVNTTNIPADNLVNTTNIPADEACDDINMDEYMERFEKIQSHNDKGKKLLENICKLRPSAGRLEGELIECIISLQNQNDEMYNLLVEMNNLFGK